ncbi:MAG: hypothetical protein JW947_06710 [Sedimentisphaerales bacterium]|nr:hypothetical protein [Sedimentisphaerales bacterium]
MFKILGDKQMIVKLILIVFLFTTFLIGEIHAAKDVNAYIDYVSIYNQKSRPANYKEEDNAATYYQKAIEARVYTPQEIRYYDWRIWPGNLSEQNLQTTRRWVKNNSLALEYFTQASKKPYFWTEKKSDDGSVLSILLPDLDGIKKLAQLTCCRAMLEAMDRDMSSAAKDVETVYRVGNHFKGLQKTIEQAVGISFKARAIETVLIIIQNTHINKKEREYLYNSLKKYIDNEKFIPDLSAMKLTCLDCLQRMYILNKNGKRMIDEKSSLIQLCLFRIRCTSQVLHSYDSIKKCYKPKLLKMNYEKAAELITEKLDRLEKWMPLDAWQLNEIMNQKDGVFQRIQESHPLMNFVVINAISLKVDVYERLRVKILALDVIMSVLTFEENKGRLPLDFSELQEAGLLEKVPIDPYSGKPIIYKKLDDSFTVYSYGPDFDDDGGVRTVDYNRHNGDIVVWPVEKYKEPTPKQQ